MAHFVLVHGAYHGGWCWERLAPLLEDHGHEVWAPDLPGMGQDARSGQVATIEEWAEFIAARARAGPRPILVGHSRGGLVISRTAELIPDQLLGLVYLAAVLAPPGVTMMDAVGFLDMPPEIAQARQLSADGRTSTWSSRVLARRVFYSETDALIVDRAFERFSPEPAANISWPLAASRERYGRVPRAFIECLRDAAIPIANQRRMVAAEPCKVWTLDADHSPFYSCPQELARVLDEIAHSWIAPPAEPMPPAGHERTQ